MNVDFTKPFNKQFEKLPHKLQKQAKAAIALFLDDVVAPSLRNHALTGKWAGHRSISAGGDLRLHFKIVNETTVLFVAVGSHSQLYK
ncbi:MAG TPA: type II toxin-antitoxin system mRNA interferase toxin, RelE/StbE family [Candidatus Saccharimonadales bacterium]|nr:type II toxin-antitoxin system mRNA interferase toxin, RelE/StbE family [Candidatus Saccharimonadales bacterium]